MENEMGTSVDTLVKSVEDFKESYESKIEELEAKTLSKIGYLENKMLSPQNADELITKNNDSIMEVSMNTNESIEQKNAFIDYVKSGNEAKLNEIEQKSLSTISGTDGGFFIPQTIHHNVENNLEDQSIIRKLASTITISSSDIDILVDKEGTDAGWVAETDPRDKTKTPKLAKIKIPVHELYAKPRATQKLLDDSQIDVEAWLARKIAQEFAKLENQAFISGDGNNKPKGFLSYPTYSKQLGEPVQIDSWGKIEEIRTGRKGGFEMGKAFDTLLDTTTALKSKYHQNASWIMSRTAYDAIRKVKDNNGNNIWQPSMMEGKPSTLFGYPVHICDDMPQLEPNKASKSIAFGDFRSAYQIVDRAGINLLRDPFSSKPHVELYTTKRLGGDVIDFDAIKLINFDK